MQKKFDIESEKNKTVGDIIIEHPQLRPRLEQLGIDYCCGGKKTFIAAVQEAGLEWPKVVAQLQAEMQRIMEQSIETIDWNGVSPTALADHIQKKHHAFMKEQLPRLDALLARVQKAHGAKHGVLLGKLRGIYDALRQEMEPHLMKEEQVIFPAIRLIDAYVSGPRPALDCKDIVQQIRKLELEHVSAGALLTGMQQVTESYHAPADACQSFMALYDGLGALESDLHEHIHLENNILFPKGVSMMLPEKNVQTRQL